MMALMKPRHLKQERSLEPWIETFTGRKFYFLDPKEDQIDIRDIAHSLAFTCRYTGHSKRFYSVAEHSVLVSYMANNPLAGLLHDASEAYITDIASPIKPHLANYKELEDMIMHRIATKFGFDYPLDADIKDCDATQLKTEARHLLHSGGIPWAHLYPTTRAHGIRPSCYDPETAERVFLERFEEVRNELAFESVESVEPNYQDFNSRRNVAGTMYRCSVQNVATDRGSLPNPRFKEPSGHCGEDERSEGTRHEYPDCRPCETEETDRG